MHGRPKLDQLKSLDRTGLVDWWTRLYGAPPPRLHRSTLALGLAYNIQEQESGGLSRRHAGQLRQLVESRRGSGRVSVSSPLRLAPGIRLVREWEGRTHSVDVTDDGFRWDGRAFGSLSAVARAITGTRWSGPRFFGLNGSVQHEQRAEQGK